MRVAIRPYRHSAARKPIQTRRRQRVRTSRTNANAAGHANCCPSSETAVQTNGGRATALGSATAADHWFFVDNVKTDNTVSARSMGAHSLRRRQLVAAIHCRGSAGRPVPAPTDPTGRRTAMRPTRQQAPDVAAVGFGGTSQRKPPLRGRVRGLHPRWSARDPCGRPIGFSDHDGCGNDERKSCRCHDRVPESRLGPRSNPGRCQDSDHQRMANSAIWSWDFQPWDALMINNAIYPTRSALPGVQCGGGLRLGCVCDPRQPPANSSPATARLPASLLNFS
jgi:hypothetical protein